VAHGIVNRVVPSSAFALGVVRAIVHGTFLISVLLTTFSTLGRLPPTILRPTGAMKLLPWSFYDQLQTPSGMLIFKSAMVLSLLLIERSMGMANWDNPVAPVPCSKV